MEFKLNEWLAFTNQVEKHFDEKQKALQETFLLSSYDRYNWNQHTGNLLFFNNDTVQVMARFQFIGSLSFTMNTWLWGWDNPTFEYYLKDQIYNIKAVGQANNFSPLIDAEWDADENDAWLMAAISAHLLDFKGVYRSLSAKGITFLGITEINYA